MCPHTNYLNRLKRDWSNSMPSHRFQGSMLTCFTSCWHALLAADMASSEKGLNQLDVLASILEEQFLPIVRETNLLSDASSPGYLAN
jgi:hypothetical protein